MGCWVRRLVRELVGPINKYSLLGHARQRQNLVLRCVCARGGGYNTRTWGNEERDRRLEVVKLHTALSYRVVGGSFIFAVFHHSS